MYNKSKPCFFPQYIRQINYYQEIKNKLFFFIILLANNNNNNCQKIKELQAQFNHKKFVIL